MENLFAEFNGASLKDWKEKVIKDLKDQPFEALLSKDDNDLIIEPFYNRENTASETAAITQQGWRLRQSIVVTDVTKANKEALTALNTGADALNFDLRPSGMVDFIKLLAGIELPYIKVSFLIGDNYKTIIGDFEIFLTHKGIDSANLAVAFHFDPIGNYFGNPGTTPLPDGKSYFDFYKQSGKWSSISANAAIYQNAGANSVSQLAFAVAHVHEYLSRIGDDVPNASEICVNIELSAGTLFFEEIAKLRALPSLIRLLFHTYDLRPRLNLNIQTSDIYRSPADAYTNLLRDSIAGMAAVIGGCNDLDIHAFNAAQASGKELENGRRLALNQQLIFKEESHLDKVADMSAGSFYIEKRTETMAQKAWALFQAIEKEGGLLAYFASGRLKQDIGQQANDLLAKYREGQRVLIGVNKFPNPAKKERKHEPKSQSTDDKGIQPINLAEELLRLTV